MTTCPADGVLQRLLINGMSEEEEAALEAHVVACAGCQRRLDLLTASASIVGAAQQLADAAYTPTRILEPWEAEQSGRPVDRASTSPTTGKPRFTVLKPHAEGGLGRVHIARDEQLQRTVALKEIRPERAGDPIVRQRFLNEAEITGQLEHPGVVPIYALENDATGRPVYAMRFIQGRTMRDAIKSYHQQPTPLVLHELLQQFVSVCQTVAYAHSKHVIHRDLKPENVMLGDFGETLVVDWGLAKRIGEPDEASVANSGLDRTAVTDSSDSSSLAARVSPRQTMIRSAGQSTQLTEVGQMLGTPAYMSPEQARGQTLTTAADVYSLGAVLYELLAGKAPYHGKSSMDVLQKVISGAPAELAGVPRALNAICRKAMAREARERYSSAADLAHDVERWLADEPVSACRERWPERVGRWIRRHRTLAASLGVAASLLLFSAVGVGWWQEHLAEERRVEENRLAEKSRIEENRLAEESRLEDNRRRLQIDAILDRCEAAVREQDVAGARRAIDDAEKHAGNLRSDRPADRLVRCRSAVDLLGELERIDDLLWTEEGRSQGIKRAVGEWPGAFKRLGVTLGQTPVKEAARAINGSLARERLLAALDLWLVYSAAEDRAVLPRILAAADPDPFRNAIRAALQRADWKSAEALVLQDEALNQPARFATALGSIPYIPRDRVLIVLWRSAQVRPWTFTALMTAGSLYPINNPNTAADRIVWFRAAISARPDRSVAHLWLGLALADKGDLDGAITEYRTAIALEPKYTEAFNSLGSALSAKGDLGGAIAAYRTSLKLEPKGLTHYNLGLAMLHSGDLDGAIAEYRTAEKAYPKRNPKESIFSQRLAQIQRWRTLLPRLDQVATGKVEPASSHEALEFAVLCRQPFLKRYAGAAQLYVKAFAANSGYAANPVFRHEAARCAALAGCGLGADAPPDASARASLRDQALVWLQMNRIMLVGQLASGNAIDRKFTTKKLSEYLAEKELAEVRPGAARVGWSPSEVAAWDTYWSDIRAMLAKANQTAPSTK